MQLETYESLSETPKGAVEVVNGEFKSITFDKSLPYRIFSPEKPDCKKWDPNAPSKHKPTLAQEGMRLVVYVINLKGVPRPGSASDREIIEGLIKDNLLVVAVDYKGEHFEDHLGFQKDINKLFFTFGGKQNKFQGSLNRKNLLEGGDWNNSSFFASFPFPEDGSKPLTITERGTYPLAGDKSKQIPINRSAIYVIPSGYTVEAHVVINDKIKGTSWPTVKGKVGMDVDNLFVDIIFPKASAKTEKVPLLLDGSSAGSGDFVINVNTVCLYSWLFNGYALASMNYVHIKPFKLEQKVPKFTQIHAVRYLRWQKERFSLSGKIGTTGVSKSNFRCYVESNFKDQKTPVDLEPYGDQPSDVSVCMPAIGYFGNEKIWDNLDENSTPFVLTWGHKNGYGFQGPALEELRDKYLAAGLKDKLLYIDEPIAGHEYNVYHLNAIMDFFDKFCKPGVGSGRDKVHVGAYGQLIFEDTFERNESQEKKDEPGNEWTTSSERTADGHKQVDLRDGVVYIHTHESANHSISFRHEFAFTDGTVGLRFKLENEGDKLQLNFADMKLKTVHAGHLFDVTVSLGNVYFEDKKTGRMDLKIRAAIKSGSLPKEKQALLLKTKRKSAKHSIEKGAWHDLLVHVEGDKISVEIDGKKAGSFQSKGFAHPTKGLLRLLVPGHAVVDDVKIWRKK